MKKMSILIVLALVGLLVAGCTQVPVNPGNPGGQNQQQAGGQNNQPAIQVTNGVGSYNEPTFIGDKTQIKTLNFQSEEEYNNFILANTGASNNYYGGGMMRESYAMDSGVAVKSAVAPAAAPMASGTASSSLGGGSNSYSTTNNQVANVDEADIIKTDGNYIYTLSSNTVYIVKAYPGEDAATVGKLKFKDRPEGLFVQGNKLAVFGNFYDLDFFKTIDFIPKQGMTYFNIYDITDKANPKLEKEYKFEGSYFQARMNGDFVYFVTVTQPEYRRGYPTPMMLDGTVKSSIPVKDIYYFPIPYENPQLASIHPINLKTDAKSESKSVTVEYSQNMYMSENNIYITYTKNINEWQITKKVTIDLMMDKLTQSDKELIAKIKATDNEVLSQNEKENKILQIVQTYIQYMSQSDQETLQEQIANETQRELDTYDYFEWTVVNKVSAKDGNVDVVANNKVPGHVINQFSMDEYNNVFRIATTLSQRWSPIYYTKMAGVNSPDTQKPSESSSNVFTMNDNLEVLGSVKELAKGEDIQSTRFMGDRLYMVTFKQVDPFFVIDLKNPVKPSVLGKLKIPGFSRYLHPYDDNTIIGIGRDASAVTGQQKGLKISLFDVTDVENPKEIAKFVTDEKYAQSTAEYEHKAFLFDKDKQLLVIPAYNYAYDYRGQASEGSYNGAMVFNITKTDIELRGIIDHSNGRADSSYYYGPTVERSLFINDMLYTKSEGLLRINKLSDLSKVKNIEFDGASSPYPVY